MKLTTEEKRLFLKEVSQLTNKDDLHFLRDVTKIFYDNKRKQENKEAKALRENVSAGCRYDEGIELIFFECTKEKR